MRMSGWQTVLAGLEPSWTMTVVTGLEPSSAAEDNEKIRTRTMTLLAGSAAAWTCPELETWGWKLISNNQAVRTGL